MVAPVLIDRGEHGHHSNGSLIEGLKKLLSHVPQNCDEEPSLSYEPGDEMRQVLKEIVPENPNQPYDMKEALRVSLMKILSTKYKDFAENMIVGFARLAGKSVGVVANQPAYLAEAGAHASPKVPVLCVSAILSIFHCWCLKMSQDFARYRPRVERNYYQRREVVVCL